MSIADVIYQRMKDDMEIVVEKKPESEIVKFYEGRKILVTGGTDLLGKCLLEKLLRDCPYVDRIYLLIRIKKDEDFKSKYNKLCDDNIFDTLRDKNPNFKDKLTPINGDLASEKLGLSDEDYEVLTGNVNMIFHNGAANKLNEQVSVALKTNVLGTKRMLELARECKHLKAFVYVSSAYSNCQERIVEEKFYRSPADLKTVNDMIAADTETSSGLTNEALNMLLGEWPNIFTFTKATAEDLVQQYAPRSTFACCVFRPSVVISTYKEPKPGFCDVKNGPASLFVKIAMGAIHVMYNVDYPCDLIPADMSVNAMLVCAWDAVDRWQTEPEAFVYNYGTSQEKPITMRQIKDKIMEEPNVLSSVKSKRRSYVIFVTNFLMYFALRIIIDYIPALIIDVLSMVHGKTPSAWSLVRESMGDMCRLRRFTIGNWRVRMPETIKALDKLNSRDRELFFSDVRQLDWADFFLTFSRGIKRHAMKEPLEELQDRNKCRCCCANSCKCPCVCVGFMLTFAFLAYYAQITARGAHGRASMPCQQNVGIVRTRMVDARMIAKCAHA